MKVKPHKIVLLYLIISLTWVLISDHLVQLFSLHSGIRATLLQTGKGFFFVLITALLLYFSIRKQYQLLLNYGEQYKNLFHSNPDSLWIYDITTLKFLEVNDAAIRTYGYSREEFKNMIISDLFPEKDSQRALESFTNVSESSDSSETWQHIIKSGKILTVAISSHKISFNKRECGLVMVQDITLRLVQEERLRLSYETEKDLKEELENNIILLKQSLDSKQKLAEVINRINNMVIITDPAGVVIWVNPAFENFTGYRFKEVIGKSCSFLYSPETDHEGQETIAEHLKGKDFASFEALNYTRDGKEYWVEQSISAIYNENDEVVRYISIQNIITERKIREQKIKEQNKILRKHSWTNSHAIRRPVASILSLLSLSGEMDDIEEVREIHSLIKVCSEELDTIIRDIGKEINASEEEEGYYPPFSA